MNESFFEKMYGASEQVKDEVKKPVVEKRLKRKLQSAHDDAEERNIDAEKRASEARENFADYNINEILSAKRSIKVATELQELIKEEYMFLFGEEMPV